MNIYPFRGVIYNNNKVGDLSRVFCPPYDIISPRDRDGYYQMSPYNIIRVILNRPEAADNEKANVYTRAAGFMNEWLDEGVLVFDEEPCIYVYTQIFEYNNKKRASIGFIAIAKIPDSCGETVLPHEKTFDGPKSDREKLMYTACANLSSIHTIIQDEDSAAKEKLKGLALKAEAFIDVKIDGVEYKAGRVRRAEDIAGLQAFMRGRKAFIADGHHRYEASRNLRARMRREDKDCNPRKGYNYVMMYFTSPKDEGITILSTHRLIKDFGGIRLREFLSAAEEFFKVTQAGSSKEMFELMESASENEHMFGLYCEGKFTVLKLKDLKVMDEEIKGAVSEGYKRLDVVILHRLLLEKIAGLSEAAAEHAIFYTRESSVAVRLVDEEKYKAAFFLNPTRISQVMDICLSTERMPHKSTYFYPKLLTGVVMRKLDGMEVKE